MYYTYIDSEHIKKVYFDNAYCVMTSPILTFGVLQLEQNVKRLIFRSCERYITALLIECIQFLAVKSLHKY